MDGLVKAFDGLVLQVGCISQQLLDILLRHVALALNEVGAILRQSKLCEEVSLNGMLEESVLSFLRVVVHAITENRKVNVVFLSSLNQEQVILVMSVSIHKRHHALEQHVCLHLVKLVQNRAVHLVNKACHNFVHPVLRNSSQVSLG